MNRNFNEFTDFKSLGLEVPTFCFVTGCVSARRDRRPRFDFNVPFHSWWTNVHNFGWWSQVKQSTLFHAKGFSLLSRITLLSPTLPRNE
jgi:hypothetical protein